MKTQKETSAFSTLGQGFSPLFGKILFLKHTWDTDLVV